jgi:hypothetical protein
MNNSNTALPEPLITALDTNTLLIQDKATLKLIEGFMGYPEGYLSHRLTWNDLMPVTKKLVYVFNLMFQFNASKRLKESVGYLDIEIAFNAINHYIQWYNQNK